MDITEKLLWLYDKLDELTGILYDLSGEIEIKDAGIEKAINTLWNEFNAFQRLKIKLESD